MTAHEDRVTYRTGDPLLDAILAVARCAHAEGRAVQARGRAAAAGEHTATLLALARAQRLVNQLKGAAVEPSRERSATGSGQGGADQQGEGADRRRRPAEGG
jgi:hypothetical protein